MKTNQLIRIFLCLFFVLALQGCNQKKEATSVEKTLNLLPSEPQKKIPNPFNENKTRAEQGDASAQYNLGYAYATGKGVAKDEVEAVNWFRKSASQNNTKAQVYLGNCYMDGVGVKKNIEEEGDDEIDRTDFLNVVLRTLHSMEEEYYTKVLIKKKEF